MAAGLFLNNPSRVLHGLADIFHFQFRIGFQDFLRGFPGSQEAKDNGNGDPHTANGWLAKANSGIDGDSVELHGVSPLMEKR